VHTKARPVSQRCDTRESEIRGRHVRHDTSARDQFRLNALTDTQRDLLRLTEVIRMNDERVGVQIIETLPAIHMLPTLAAIN
jgi:hypothetical protein